MYHPLGSSKKHLKQLISALSISKDDPRLYQVIVDTPFADRLLTTYIDLGIIVLLLINPKSNTLDRVALSKTEHADAALRVSAKPFNDIRIPLTATDNLLIEAINTNTNIMVEDWKYLFSPILTPEESRRNQSSASIECSLVWPLQLENGGAMIFSFYQPREYITKEHYDFAENYVKLVTESLGQKPLLT